MGCGGSKEEVATENTLRRLSTKSKLTTGVAAAASNSTAAPENIAEIATSNTAVVVQNPTTDRHDPPSPEKSLDSHPPLPLLPASDSKLISSKKEEAEEEEDEDAAGAVYYSPQRGTSSESVKLEGEDKGSIEDHDNSEIKDVINGGEGVQEIKEHDKEVTDQGEKGGTVLKYKEEVKAPSTEVSKEVEEVA